MRNIINLMNQNGLDLPPNIKANVQAAAASLSSSNLRKSAIEASQNTIKETEMNNLANETKDDKIDVLKTERNSSLQIKRNNNNLIDLEFKRSIDDNKQDTFNKRTKFEQSMYVNQFVNEFKHHTNNRTHLQQSDSTIDLSNNRRDILDTNLCYN